MQALAQLALMILCFLMFKVKREYKLAIMLLSAICFNNVTLTFIPFGTSRFILCICFLLSELPYIVSHYKAIKTTVLKPLMIAMIIATVILAICSPHYDNIVQYIRIILNELICTYFIICYSFLSIKNEKDLLPSFKIAYYGLLVLTVFAVLNYVTKHAVFIDEMLKGRELTDVMEDAGGKFTYADRFRVQAMFFNPFDYGYICIVLLLFNWYGYMQSFISKNRFYIILVCCVFGIITCGCRTNLLCCLIGAFAYMLLAFNVKKNVRYFTFFVLIGIVLFATIPFFQEKIGEMLSMFNTNSSVGGSSIEMRIIQYAAVLYHIQDHFLFGRGLDYFNIDLGWKEGKQFLVDKDLFGLEGVLMNRLLERGIIGVCFYFFFYVTLLVFMIKNRRLNKQISALGISVLVTYIAFANMTGELSSVFPSLLIIGLCVKILYSKNTLLKKEHT